jgi:hypothetical protein
MPSCQFCYWSLPRSARFDIGLSVVGKGCTNTSSLAYRSDMPIKTNPKSVSFNESMGFVEVFIAPTIRRLMINVDFVFTVRMLLNVEVIVSLSICGSIYQFHIRLFQTKAPLSQRIFPLVFVPNLVG